MSPSISNSRFATPVATQTGTPASSTFATSTMPTTHDLFTSQAACPTASFGSTSVLPTQQVELPSELLDNSTFTSWWAKLQQAQQHCDAPSPTQTHTDGGPTLENGRFICLDIIVSRACTDNVNLCLQVIRQFNWIQFYKLRVHPCLPRHNNYLPVHALRPTRRWPQPPFESHSPHPPFYQQSSRSHVPYIRTPLGSTLC
jgi:hypothetical protein